MLNTTPLAIDQDTPIPYELTTAGWQVDEPIPYVLSVPLNH